MLDRQRIRAAFGAAAQDYEGLAVLQREVGRELVERCIVLEQPPQRVLDVGCGTGLHTAALKQRYRKAEVIGLDLALPMLRQTRRHSRWWRPLRVLAGDVLQLPLADRSVDLVYSNLCLQWCEDLHAAFYELRRVLRPGGLLLFSTFGPDTLRELRAAWQAADDAAHVHRFLDVHDIGNAVMAQAYADPVFDVERYTLTYTDVRQLMRELKGIGAGNALAERRRGLTGRSAYTRMLEAYESFRVNGRLPATYEVVYGQAFAPQENRPLRDRRGELVQVSVDSLREQLRRRRGG